MTTTIYDFAELLADGVLIADGSGIVVHANTSLSEMSGYSAGELAGQHLSILIPEEHRAEHGRFFEEFRDGEESHRPMAGRSILYALHRDGTRLPVSISIAKIEDGEKRLIAIIRPLPSELSELKLQAQSDALTGAANRVYLSARIKELVERSEQFGLLYLDLDGFKPINDAHGHAAGDQILKIVVQRTNGVVRSTDLVARVGGDEFVVVLTGVTAPAELESIANKIRARIAETMNLEEVTVSLTASVGSVVSPRDGTDEKTLLARADSAMYLAKRGGTGYRAHGDAD